ncbi:uncharacterized protein LOC114449227 [Parambassis ranga]|uniref:Uncharacterized protein LOC114449227 n=1 Tax=Parambassis ranga TaxID=210632 RepID=A0A6P7JZW4_9TELE|nr:uncharacterized protein LOC114449227 [Parambassis ranga]
MNTFKKDISSEKVKVNELSDSDRKLLKEFKQELTDTISALLADASVEVFHQKFSTHLVSHVQNNVNGVIGNYVRKGLKTERTEEKLRAGQHNSYIAYMSATSSSKPAGVAVQTHAEKIQTSTTTGTILDVRVLSETTGTKVVILTQDKNGRLTKMQELNPSTKPASETVTLIYRPKSAQYPDGHYDVQINDKIVTVDNKGKSCLFHALARGMKPDASDEEISSEAGRLRTLEADTLLKHPGQWEPFIKRKEWTDAIREGDWYMEEGAGPKKIIKENKKVLKTEVGKVKLYKEWQKYKQPYSNLGKIINADHQPPDRNQVVNLLR